MTVGTPHPQLKRELGVLGAILMGLGSIIGTGVFVSIGIAAGIAGPAVILAVFIGAAVGADVLGQATGQTKAAPLEVAVRSVAGSGGAFVLAIGGMTAMLGVLLNLILGLSRVLLAMGRRRDMPRVLARLNQQQTTPYWAVLVVGVAIALLVVLGNVKTTWSFSAFNVLIYYAITNLAALRLPPQERLYSQWLAWLGLGSCLFLAFWVEFSIWQVGLGLIVAGLIWHKIRQID